MHGSSVWSEHSTKARLAHRYLWHRFGNQSEADMKAPLPFKSVNKRSNKRHQKPPENQRRNNHRKKPPDTEKHETNICLGLFVLNTAKT